MDSRDRDQTRRVVLYLYWTYATACPVAGQGDSTNRMLTFFSWLTVAGFVVSIFLMVWILHRGFQVLYVRITEPGINDHAAAVENFVGMLSDAKESMIVYDDGENTAGSLYNAPQVISAVQDKLRVNPGFVLQCLFDRDNDLLFRMELAGNPQVTIRTRGSSEQSHDIHYTIIDGGAKAYLSRHRLGSSERRVKTVDCTDVSPRHRERIANVVLGRYMDHFQRTFVALTPTD